MKRILSFLCAGFVLSHGSSAFAANLYISEFQYAGVLNGKDVQVAQVPSSKDSVVAFGAKSSAFLTTTNIVRLWCDAQCSIKFGNDATLTSSPATNQNLPLSGTTAAYFQVPPNSQLEVSVVSNP